jgi:hypothetical protein
MTVTVYRASCPNGVAPRVVVETAIHTSSAAQRRTVAALLVEKRIRRTSEGDETDDGI